MRVCHNVSADFDDPNLIALAGLVPVMTLAEKAGLADLVREHVSVPGSAGANAELKVATLVAGMVAGADSIEDMDLVRHGGMPKLFTGCRAPTTLGTHLRGYQFGHVRQLDAVASRLLVNLAGQAPCWWVGPTRSPTSTSMTRCAKPMGMPSKASGTATPGPKG